MSDEEEIYSNGLARLGQRTVALTKLRDGRFVSTVYLVEYENLDNARWADTHGLRDLVLNPYETIVVPGYSHERRWKMRQMAEIGHALLVEDLGGAHADQSTILREFFEGRTS